MHRNPLLTSLLWGSVSAAMVGSCGGDEPGKSSPSPGILVPAVVDFAVTCGEAPKAVTFRITSVGDQPVFVKSATATGGFVITAELPITLQPGATIAVQVQPPAAVIGTDRGGTAKLGKVTIESDDPEGNAEIVLRANVHGANLALVDAANKPVTRLVMASSTTACPDEAMVFLHNSGDRPATAGDTAGDYPSARVSESSTVAPGESLQYSISPVLGEGCAPNGEVRYQATGPVCTVLPAVLAVSQTTGGGSDVCFCNSTSGQ
jgi:hypothetical protein